MSYDDLNRGILFNNDRKTKDLMKAEELSKLTPVGKRIKVSELLGWTCCGVVPGQEPHGLPPWRKLSDYSTQDVLDGNVPMNTLPDWAKDLNLCREFEKTLNPSEIFGESQPWDNYVMNLCQTSKGTHGFHATADSKVDAFLLTVL